MPSTATDIAWSVRNNVLKAADVVERHLAAIDDRDGEIHAFNTVTADIARARAAEIDAGVEVGRDMGPLAGVPIALKDNMCTRGIPTTCSSKILDGWKPPYDATIVTRLHDAGAILIGKTNLDEFAMGSSTENSAFGPTRNPHDLVTGARWIERRIGGRGGRRLRPARARLRHRWLDPSTGGAVRRGRREADVRRGEPVRPHRVRLEPRPDRPVRQHRRRRRARARSDLRPRPDGLDVDRPAAGDGPLDLTGQLDRGVAGLRVGRITDLPAGASPDVSERLEQAFDALRAGGAEIVDVQVPAYGYGLTAYYLIAPAEASSNLARYDGVRFGLRVEAPDTNAMYMATRTAGFGDEVKRRIMLGTYALSAGYYDAYYGRALKVRRLIANDFAAAYEQVDVLLTPTSPTVAFPIGDKTADPMSMYLCDTYTIPSNLSGEPAMSVPFGTGEAGLPVGVQVLAPALKEDVMFRVAAELERAATALVARLGTS